MHANELAMEMCCIVMTLPRCTARWRKQPDIHACWMQSAPAWNDTKYAAVIGLALYNCLIMHYFDHVMPLYIARLSVTEVPVTEDGAQ